MAVDRAIGSELAERRGCDRSDSRETNIMSEPADDVRTIFTKAAVGQDGTNIHLSFETEREADAAFEYICELGTMPESRRGGAMTPASFVACISLLLFLVLWGFAQLVSKVWRGNVDG